jgi:prepilin-type N-terminal cleavage/methylation domain-containing protein
MKTIHAATKRPGFTLIELLVVIAIIAVLIGLLVPAVQKVREAAARSEASNNLKQIALACHSYHGQYKKLPGSYAYPSTYTEGAISGAWSYILLPFIEQDPMYKAGYGQLQTSSNYTYDYVPPQPPYSYTNKYPANGYQAFRVKGVIKTYTSPLDPTVDSVDSPISFVVNTNVLTSYYSPMTLSKITDGTSNTTMIAEGYSKAGYQYSYSYNYTTAHPPYTYSYTENYSYVRSWNYDPMNTVTTYKTRTTGSQASGSLSYAYTNAYSIYGYYTIYGASPNGSSSGNVTVPFQVKPAPDAADYRIPQSGTMGGLLVAFADGSIRTVSPSVSLLTWQAAGTPNSGDTIGNDLE